MFSVVETDNQLHTEWNVYHIMRFVLFLWFTASTQVDAWPVSAKLQEIIEKSNNLPVSSRLRAVIKDADRKYVDDLRRQRQQNRTAGAGGGSSSDSDSNSSEEDYFNSSDYTTGSYNTSATPIPNRKPSDINAGMADEGRLPTAAKERRGRQIGGLLAVATLGLVAGVGAITVVAFKSKKPQTPKK